MEFMKRIAVINPDATEEVRSSIKKLDFEPVEIGRSGAVAAPLSGHPDIQLFIHENTAFCHPDISVDFLKKIEGCCGIVICGTRIGKYPADTHYNIACIGRTALHRTEFTENTVRGCLESRGVGFINVTQGYAKCSTAVLGARGIITEDSVIHEKADSPGLESLLIAPGNVALPGYAHGFIGGATGHYGRSLVFTGCISHLPESSAIMDFIEKNGHDAVFLSRERITDLGTIFFING
jgi:hypothetical protein